MRRGGLVAVAAAASLLQGCAVAPVAFDPAARLPRAARDHSEQQIVVTIGDIGAGVRTPAGGSPRPYAAAGSYSGGSLYAQRLAARLAREYGLDRVAVWYIAPLEVQCVVYEARDAEARDLALARLRTDPRVESAEPMRRFVTGTDATPYNDPYYRLQTGVEELHVAAAHQWSRGRGVTVAVVDTGIDLSHPDIRGRVRLARNFVDDDAAQFSRDRHGTAVAGVLAAAANNGIGIVGVAPEVELLALKACWYGPAGGSAVCNTLTLAAALAAAIEQRVQVINLSLSGPADPLLRRLVERALGTGIAVVAAIPDGTDPDRAFPAQVPGVLGVADADVSAVLSGPECLAAPGHDVLTLTPEGRYDFASGASLSTAMVSGIVALLLERRRSLTPAEVGGLITRTANILERNPHERIVNACGAVAALVPSASCGRASPPGLPLARSMTSAAP